MLTTAQLKEAGIKPGPLFGKCLKLDTIEAALAFVAANTVEKPKHNHSKLTEGTIWFWLCHNDCLQGLQSVEFPGKVASNSERKRWIEQQSISINNRTDWKPDDLLPDVLTQLVFFPKGNRRCTMI